MGRSDLEKALSRYLPLPAVAVAAGWLLTYRAHLKVAPERASKLGDYRAPFKGKGHRISVNGTLNPYAFLITFTHEMAHLLVWERYRAKPAPHGREWKSAFSELMGPLLHEGVFPADVLAPLARYMQNPAASTMRDTALLAALQSHDKSPSNLPYLKDIPAQAVFRLEGNQRVFEKQGLIRKCYLCKEIKSGKLYRVRPLARVEPLPTAQ